MSRLSLIQCTCHTLPHGRMGPRQVAWALVDLTPPDWLRRRVEGHDEGHGGGQGGGAAPTGPASPASPASPGLDAPAELAGATPGPAASAAVAAPSI